MHEDTPVNDGTVHKGTRARKILLSQKDCEKWLEAESTQMRQHIIDNNVCRDPILRPKNAKVIRPVWTCTVKPNGSYKVRQTGHRSRLFYCSKKHVMQHANALNHISLCLLIAIANYKNYIQLPTDVTNTFACAPGPD